MIKKLNTTEKSFFKNSKYFDIIWNPAFAPYSNDRINTKKGIWLNLMSIQLKQSHWLLCVANEFWLVQENRATVKLDYSSGASHGMKTYSESRIELQNLQILKKIVEKWGHFVSSEQPCKLKSLDVALKIEGVEKIPPENPCASDILVLFPQNFFPPHQVSILYTRYNKLVKGRVFKSSVVIIHLVKVQVTFTIRDVTQRGS